MTPWTLSKSLAALIGGCSISFSAEIVQPSPLRPIQGQKSTLFQKIAPESSGVTFLNHLDDSHALSRLYYSGFGCGSVVMSDFNGDGRNDLFFTGGAGNNGLFFQAESSLKFTDASKDSGLLTDRWNSGATAADIDQDGDQDLLVCSYDKPLQLFLNQGKGTFLEVGEQVGFTMGDAFMTPTFCDYDRDGDLDLFVVTNQLYRKGGRPKEPPVEKGSDGKLRVKKEFDRYYGIKVDEHGKLRLDDIGRPNYLYRNDSKNGSLKFTEVSRAAGLTYSGFGLSATWFDFNNDGWPDLHVGNDFSEPDRLYLNQKNGTFKDVAKSAFPTCAWFSMGADAADIDGDGLEDLFCADMAFTTHYKQKIGMGQMGTKQALLERIRPLQVMRNHLFLNSGMGRFREAAQLAGLGKSDWTWAVKFEDLDLDGRLDLFVTNGAIRSFNHADYDNDNAPGKTNWDRWKHTPPRPEANLAFQNTGDYRFEKSAKAWGLDEVNVSHGMACGDLDGDGDPDLVVTNTGGVVSIFENTSTAPRLTITLEGAVTEGAEIKIIENRVTQRRTIRSANGYYTTTSRERSFAVTQEASAEITWPDGSIQIVAQLKPEYHYRISKQANSQPLEKAKDQFFSSPALVKGGTHREAIYDDFAKQPLLPHKLSQLGPASSTGDIDQDGDLDFFLGGAAGKPATLLLNTGTALSPRPLPAFEKDTQYEDVGSAFFDADQDGDLDLLIASGSYEESPGDPLLADRLYLNDGSGHFSRSMTLPELYDVGSCVRPCDFDLDGDLDLFIGSRVLPGAYPLSTPSRILVNESGKFSLKRDFNLTDMVTDAQWTDVDGDEIPDLIVVSEWNHPRLFLNQKGTLTEASQQAGLTELTGWWTRISAADIDGDGDLDFAVGNFGLNTKYHASPKKPALLYYGDFQGNGIKRLVEAEFENDTLFPIRGKSCSTNAMPALAKKFNSYHSFALAELDQIYNLKDKQRFDCKVLESGFLINNGEGHFEFRPLPQIAQISPIQGLVFSDLTGDGLPDLLISQNFYNPQFETGPYSGGIGLFLKNDGSGDFSALFPHESGILLPGDPRGLHLLDLTGDDLPDLVCPLNNGPLLWQRRLPLPSK